MIHYWAYISFGFVLFQLVNALLNFIFRQKIKKAPLTMHAQISVLIPARNEEHNIRFLLDDLLKMKNDNLEIIVFDDQSTDNTSQIVQEYGVLNPRIKLIQSDGLPDGWLGKNRACYQLAQQATGDYYLFVDADVRLEGSIIEDAVYYLDQYKLSLLSVFPTQIQKTLGEKISVPIMNYILLTLLPLVFVRLSLFSSHAAANGQFMLFNALKYAQMQPHEVFKASAIEDIAISRYFKQRNLKIACLTGEKRIQCRMYKSYQEALNGFSKNVFMFFGNQPILAFLFWMFAALGFVPILLTQPIHLPIYCAVVILIQLLYSFSSRQNLIINVLLFPLQMVFLCQVMIKSILNKKQKQYTWKGRNIYS